MKENRAEILETKVNAVRVDDMRELAIETERDYSDDE